MSNNDSYPKNKHKNKLKRSKSSSKNSIDMIKHYESTLTDFSHLTKTEELKYKINNNDSLLQEKSFN